MISNSDGASEAQDIDPNDDVFYMNYDVRTTGMVGIWLMDGRIAHESHLEYNASRSDGVLEDYWFWIRSCAMLGPAMPVRRLRLRAGVRW